MELRSSDMMSVSFFTRGAILWYPEPFNDACFKTLISSDVWFWRFPPAVTPGVALQNVLGTFKWQSFWGQLCGHATCWEDVLELYLFDLLSLGQFWEIMFSLNVIYLIQIITWFAYDWVKLSLMIIFFLWWLFLEASLCMGIMQDYSSLVKHTRRGSLCNLTAYGSLYPETISTILTEFLTCIRHFKSFI